jgi:hypothetical protein
VVNNKGNTHTVVYAQQYYIHTNANIHGCAAIRSRSDIAQTIFLSEMVVRVVVGNFDLDASANIMSVWRHMSSPLPHGPLEQICMKNTNTINR